jgi:hypothetical protein
MLLSNQHYGLAVLDGVVLHYKSAKIRVKNYAKIDPRANEIW